MNFIIDAIRNGFEPGLSATGTLHVAFQQTGLVNDAFVSIGHDSVTLTGQPTESPIASVHLDDHGAQLFSEGRLDIRNPETLKRFRMRGNLAFIHSVASMCQKPDAAVKAILSRAIKTSRKRSIKNANRVRNLPTQSALLARIDDGCPTVFEKCLSESILAWNFQSLREAFGGCNITANRRQLRNLIDRMLEGQAVYSCGAAMPQPMVEEFAPSWLTKCDFETGPLQIWMGSKKEGLVTGLHREFSVPLLMQVIGRKKLLLFSPDQAELVYAQKAFNHYQQCWVDPHAPDLAFFPKFSHAKSLSIILHPGEMLLIPPGWFHCAYAIDDVLSVSTVILSQNTG